MHFEMIYFNAFFFYPSYILYVLRIFHVMLSCQPRQQQSAQAHVRYKDRKHNVSPLGSHVFYNAYSKQPTKEGDAFSYEGICVVPLSIPTLSFNCHK